MIDHLLCAAMIEGRSCEKFQILAEALASVDQRLAKFYGDLVESEGNHYASYLLMAKRIDELETERRLEFYLELDAELVVHCLATFPFFIELCARRIFPLASTQNSRMFPKPMSVGINSNFKEDCRFGRCVRRWPAESCITKRRNSGRHSRLGWQVLRARRARWL